METYKSIKKRRIQLAKQIGNRIKEERKERNWTQANLGNLTRSSTSMIWRMENDEQLPTLTALFGVANALQVPLISLLEEDDAER